MGIHTILRCVILGASEARAGGAVSVGAGTVNGYG